jgi:hypothetical protein
VNISASTDLLPSGAGEKKALSVEVDSGKRKRAK